GARNEGGADRNVWRVSVLLGRGDGTFAGPAAFPVGTGCRALAVGDVNGDGALDVVTVNSPSFTDGSYSVLLGNGDGTFRRVNNYALALAPGAAALADVNNDGVLDLVVTVNPFSGPGGVGVLLGNGDGTFGPARVFPTGPTPRSLVVADLNGDGSPDVATANTEANVVSVLLGNG